MIYPYVGEFLVSPVPLQLSFNWCSHACSYCFANLNSPNRSFDLKEFQTQLKNMYTNNGLTSVLLRERYPVLISNLVDPFATSNYGVAVPVMEMMTNMEIPIMIQTRGGRGVDDVLSFLPPSMWYISIPMLNDDIRKKIEPGAPSIESRFQLIDKLKAHGHEVLVGVSPTEEMFLPGKDRFQLLDILKAKGVHGIWIAQLHLNAKQLRIMPDQARERLGESLIEKGIKNAKKIEPSQFEFMDSIKKYALSIGIEVEGLYEGGPNHLFRPFYSLYKKGFPSINNFINWCHETKADNEPVYFEEFEKLMSPGFIKGAFNISPYMRCMSKDLDEDLRASEGYKQTFNWLLKLCWNEPRMRRAPTRFWTFAVSVNYDGKKMDYNYDQQGNKYYHFNRHMFSDEFYINNK